MRRRDFLHASGLTTALTAGCLQNGRWSDEESSTPTDDAKPDDNSSTSTETPVSLPEDATLTGWPMLGANPAHTGSVTDDPPALSEPSRRWEHTTPGTPTTPPIVGGDIIVVAISGAIRAIERSTGNLVWETDVESGVNGSPVIHDGTVYAGLHDTGFVALDARTGDEEWHYEFDRVQESLGGNIVNTPAVAGDTVMITINGYPDTIHAASVADGSTRWSADSRKSPTHAVTHDDHVHIGGTVLDRTSGEVVRRYSIDRDDHVYVPAATDDSIFIINGFDRLMSFPSDGTSADWETSFPGGNPWMPVVEGNTVYVAEIAFDRSDGTQQFELPTEHFTTPAVAGDLGLFPRQETLVSFDPSDGTVRWEEPITWLRNPKQPAIAEDGAFVSTGEGVIAFE